jgi:hypothetical protein
MIYSSASTGAVQLDAPARLGRTLKEDIGLSWPVLFATQRSGVLRQASEAR